MVMPRRRRAQPGEKKLVPSIMNPSRGSSAGAWPDPDDALEEAPPPGGPFADELGEDVQVPIRPRRAAEGSAPPPGPRPRLMQRDAAGNVIDWDHPETLPKGRPNLFILLVFVLPLLACIAWQVLFERLQP